MKGRPKGIRHSTFVIRHFFAVYKPWPLWHILLQGKFMRSLGADMIHRTLATIAIIAIIITGESPGG